MYEVKYEHRDKCQRGESAQHEHRLVSEVEDVEHAEDERVTDREQGVDAAEEDPVDRPLAHRLSRSLQGLEFPVLHLLDARRVLRVALVRGGKLPYRRREAIHLR